MSLTCLRHGPGRMVLPILAGLCLSSCPGSGPGVTCPKIPGCASSCCDASLVCRDGVCDNEVWGCRQAADGSYKWIKNALPCGITESGVDPYETGVTRPKDFGSGQEGGGSCTATSCGAHATCTATGCKCDSGYTNADGSWANGCEATAPGCSVTSCGSCPAGYCGANAECRDNIKCRCIDGSWNNKDGDWSNGCEAPAPNCSATNCNECYVGYCGPAANCMQNKCECTEVGYANCDGVWEKSGCECQGTCNGTTCVP